MTLVTQAQRLGISPQALCDVEQGRRGISPARAYAWGEALQGDGQLWLQVATESLLEHDLRKLGMRARVKLFVRIYDEEVGAL